MNPVRSKKSKKSAENPPLTSNGMNYWLVKSEESCYSIDDLKKDKKTYWDGVRNYQARNFMRDMKKGDFVLFYHSNSNPIGIAGIGKVVKESYPDFTAWELKNDHYDPKSPKENPRWDMVNIGFVKKFREVIPLSELKEQKGLKDMKILQKGNRLSVTPVTKKEFEIIERMAHT